MSKLIIIIWIFENVGMLLCFIVEVIISELICLNWVIIFVELAMSLDRLGVNYTLLFNLLAWMEFSSFYCFLLSSFVFRILKCSTFVSVNYNRFHPVYSSILTVQFIFPAVWFFLSSFIHFPTLCLIKATFKNSGQIEQTSLLIKLLSPIGISHTADTYAPALS